MTTDTKQKQRHFIFHKPYGYLCQFVCELPKKKLIGELYDFPKGSMAIGRLDEDSEGLLFLTTDGMMSEIIRSKNIEKEYYAQVDGLITDEAIEKLCAGIEIGIRNVKYITKACKAFRLEKASHFLFLKYLLFLVLAEYLFQLNKFYPKHKALRRKIE